MNESSDNPPRKIIHVDMDAFFASVEQRDNAELRGQPVAVGGSAQRGVFAAASYEAQRCPSLIFVSPCFEVYRAVSQQIREIFSRYSDLLEPLSLDEAYLDVTEDKPQVGSAIRIAELIRSAIREETGLTASAGVSYNKFLAKIASDQNKPDGIFVVRPHEGAEFVASLPVRRFYGVGPKTAENMGRLGIREGADLCDKNMDFMIEHFGKSADYLYHAARGIDQRLVRSDRIRKSVGHEKTFSEDLSTDTALSEALEDVIDSVWHRIENNSVAGRTVTLKVKYADFQQITRSKSCEQCLTNKSQFGAADRALLAQLLPVPLGVRLIGLTLSNLSHVESPHARNLINHSANSQRKFDF